MTSAASSLDAASANLRAQALIDHELRAARLPYADYLTLAEIIKADRERLHVFDLLRSQLDIATSAQRPAARVDHYDRNIGMVAAHYMTGSQFVPVDTGPWRPTGPYAPYAMDDTGAIRRVQ